MRHIRHAVAATALLLLVAACGSSPSDDNNTAATGVDSGTSTSPAPSSPATDATEGSSTPTAAPAVVAKELRFDAETVDGDAFDATSLAGQDAVLWFWAPWCSECRREAPIVAAAQAELGEAVQFVGVAGLGPTDDMQAFINEMDVGAFTHLADLDGSIWQRFGVVQQPAYAFVNQDGDVEVVIGELGEDGLAEQLSTLTSG